MSDEAEIAEAALDKSDKQVWMRWYAKDWLADEALQLCSLEARGVAANFFTYTGCRSPRPGMCLMSNERMPSMVQAAAMLRC